MAVVKVADGAQQGTAPFYGERDHVDAWRLVIVMVMPSFHGLMATQVRMGGQPAPLALA